MYTSNILIYVYMYENTVIYIFMYIIHILIYLANTDIRNPNNCDPDIHNPNPDRQIEVYQLQLIRSNIEFGVSTMTYALQLIEIMNESTLHYAIETITASLKLYGFSIMNQDLCIQISQVFTSI
jgi:hypothetical protein